VGLPGFIRRRKYTHPKRKLNRELPIICNGLIAGHLDEDDGLMIVHENLEIKGGLSVIEDLAVDSVYGTFGMNFENDSPFPYGLHVCSNNGGSRAIEVRHMVSRPVSVQMLDCLSILVHMKLLRK